MTSYSNSPSDLNRTLMKDVGIASFSGLGTRLGQPLPMGPGVGRVTESPIAMLVMECLGFACYTDPLLLIMTTAGHPNAKTSECILCYACHAMGT